MHLAVLVLISPKFTVDYVDDMEDRIAAAEALPNDKVRYAPVRLKQKLLSELVNRCCDKWQFLKQYIEIAFPKETANTVLVAAGLALYKETGKWSHNYDKIATMMQSGIKVLTDKATELLANNNMPASFPAEFQAVYDDFEVARQELLQLEDVAMQQTELKMKSLNEVYGDMINAMKLGGKQYQNEPVMIQLFTFVDRLKAVRGDRDSGLKVLFMDINGNPVPDVRVSTLQYGGRSEVSNKKGRCVVKVPSGKCDFSIEKEGFVPLVLEKVQIKVGQMRTMQIQLEQTLVGAAVAAVAAPNPEALEKAVAGLQSEAAQVGDAEVAV